MAAVEPGAGGSCPIEAEADLLRVRLLLREHSRELGLVDQTKLITAGSELSRNILKYARPAGGRLQVDFIKRDCRRGLRAVFTDRGPGIPDLELALKDGYSTGGSLGLGLPGARRLVDEFSITSVLGEGTTITIVKWIR
ncbi:MAG: rsbT [Myxococcaceae bacterium]|nr:rsbT [Myxococcaceae bacterium]